MRIAIIGSGNIGGTLARLLAEAGHELAIANSKGPTSLGPFAAELGPRVRAAGVEEAAEFGDVVVLAIPWRNRDAIPAGPLVGKVVIDAMNPYAPDFSVYDLGDATSSELVLEALPGARLVKAFNTMRAQDLASRGRTDLPIDQRPAIFVASDDGPAQQLVNDLVAQIGFSPVETGSLREGGKRQQPGAEIYARLMTGAQARALLARQAGGAVEAGVARSSDAPETG
jgi:predicted dinucleotide-binding enzyme